MLLSGLSKLQNLGTGKGKGKAQYRLGRFFYLARRDEGKTADMKDYHIEHGY